MSAFHLVYSERKAGIFLLVKTLLLKKYFFKKFSTWLSLSQIIIVNTEIKKNNNRTKSTQSPSSHKALIGVQIQNEKTIFPSIVSYGKCFYTFPKCWFSLTRDSESRGFPAKICGYSWNKCPKARGSFFSWKDNFSFHERGNQREKLLAIYLSSSKKDNEDKTVHSVEWTEPKVLGLYRGCWNNQESRRYKSAWFLDTNPDCWRHFNYMDI